MILHTKRVHLEGVTRGIIKLISRDFKISQINVVIVPPAAL